MKYLIYVIFILLMSCIGDHSVLDPDFSMPTEEDLISTTSYEIIHPDTFIVYSNQQKIFSDNSLEWIEIPRQKINNLEIGGDSIVIDYEQKQKGYVMVFSQKIFNRQIATYPMLPHFHRNELEYNSISFNIEMYKYPFGSAQILFNKDSVHSCPGIYENLLNIFDFWGDDIVFHPTGSDGYYKVELDDLSCTKIYPTQSGVDFVIVSDPYLYVDTGSGIDKFDLRTYESELIIGETIDYVKGMDIKDDILYVIHDYFPQMLSRYSLDGVLIESIPFEYPVYSLTIDGNYLYSISWESMITATPNGVFRFNLITQATEISVKLDIENWMSLQIKGSNLYYIDYYKNMICYIPLSDIVFN